MYMQVDRINSARLTNTQRDQMLQTDPFVAALLSLAANTVPVLPPPEKDKSRLFVLVLNL